MFLCFTSDCQVIDSPGKPADVTAFNSGNFLESVALPIAQIGHGNSDVSGKFEAVFASIKLDVSWLLDGSGSSGSCFIFILT